MSVVCVLYIYISAAAEFECRIPLRESASEITR